MSALYQVFGERIKPFTSHSTVHSVVLHCTAINKFLKLPRKIEDRRVLCECEKDLSRWKIQVLEKEKEVQKKKDEVQKKKDEVLEKKKEVQKKKNEVLKKENEVLKKMVKMLKK
eukprot:GHVR01051830.1.p3 GENE.GHVR01051830.1~~GHVR01051830.1.p3  ORF type:complete len:114 (+),score=24.46 GHVR01051830.1:1163-1504(+)